ncbi:hypothetical protein ACTMU2_22700 [Cupriavidus basilensis]
MPPVPIRCSMVAPQPVVQAYLYAQRTFEEEARARVQDSRRDAQRRRDSLHALEAEATPGRAGDGQRRCCRFPNRSMPAVGAGRGSWRKLSALPGSRSTTHWASAKRNCPAARHCCANRRKPAPTIWPSRRAKPRSATEDQLAPLMERLRQAWGHGDTPDVFDTWLRIDPMDAEAQRSCCLTAAGNSRVRVASGHGCAIAWGCPSDSAPCLTKSLNPCWS